jgi:hypothetical protein
MALSITHSTVVVVPDDGTSPVGSDEWNDDHAITGTVGPDEGARELLTADRTYYVRTDGSDSNTGLVDSAGGAFLTLQKAYDVIAATLDLGGQDVTIDVGSGTYAPILFAQPWTGGGSIRLTGDLTTPSNVVINSATDSPIYITAPMPGPIYIGGFKLTTSGAATSNIYIYSTASVYVDGKMEYGAGRWNLLAGAPGAFLQVTGDYTISAGGETHYYCEANAVLYDFAADIQVTGTPAFTDVFARSQMLGAMVTFGVFTGAATGTRYNVDLNAIINTGGSGANYFPGDGAGSATNGGQYV